MEEYAGLREKEAREILRRVGENALKHKKRAGAIKLFAGQFRDAMIVILLVCTVISALMGEYSEALTIIAIVFLNAVLGFLQEYRTEKTLEKLGELAAPTALVVREGVARKIDARELVPGDIVRLSAGDRVPADCAVLAQNALLCDESMLSGESEPVEKGANSGGNRGRAFMGTLVTKGSATCRVTGTGPSTEMGKIAGMLGSIETGQTPLQKRLSQLSKYIGAGCLAVCAVVALTGVLRGEELFDMLLTGISLAVAAVPEGLPAIVTISLALSVGRMVKRKALVRRLHAVETLGCANVICSDKTGTLTENKMTVKQIQSFYSIAKVSGTGFEAAGEFSVGGKRIDPTADRAFEKILQIAAVCNNACVRREKSGFIKSGRVEVLGEPTEAALIILAGKAGVSKGSLPLKVEREFPFDSTRKMMSVQVSEPGGKRLLLAKGAPDILLGRCTHYLGKNGPQPLGSAARGRILEQVGEMAEDALRVLGFCYRELGADESPQETGMVFAGLCGMQDPPRKEAFDAVKKCREAGIRPVMITGDYAVTAKAIARELSIWREGERVLTGAQLDGMSEELLAGILPQISVFARVTPAHKLRIVRAFKAGGSIVAMTGDGVNDAPAVKEADIGVSMGISGTDVTKEAASVILLDDNFATLVSAVEEGRVIYQNIRKFIRYLLSCNIGEVFTMFFAMLSGLPIPLLPIQILLINLVTDGLPAVALGLDPAENDVMRRAPRGKTESVFSQGLAGTIILRGLLIGITTVAVFVALLHTGAGLSAARTGAMLTLVATQLIHVFECKSERRSLFSINPLDNLWLVMAVLVSVAAVYFSLYNPFLAAVFKTVPLSGAQLLRVLSLSAAVPLVAGVLQSLRRRQNLQNSRPLPKPKKYAPQAKKL